MFKFIMASRKNVNRVVLVIWQLLLVLGICSLGLTIFLFTTDTFTITASAFGTIHVQKGHIVIVEEVYQGQDYTQNQFLQPSVREQLIRNNKSDVQEIANSINANKTSMDILNPYRKKLFGNVTYQFEDYFDYDVPDDIKEKHSLGIIVPFRNAWEELDRFIPHLHDFLINQSVPHIFYVINQVDQLRFNRASLINVGYLEMLKDGQCDYFVMHDVDLLPLNSALHYSYPANGPIHLATPKLHPQYSKPDFVGAILLMTNGQYKQINGMSNTFWGWGREDEEFRMRLRKGHLKIHRPSGLSTTKKDTFLHLHDDKKRKRDKKVYGAQEMARFSFDNKTGLNTTRYNRVKKTISALHGVPYIMFDVELHCEVELSPWCMTPDQLKNSGPSTTTVISSPHSTAFSPTNKPAKFKKIVKRKRK